MSWSISEQLYSSKYRFLYELIQNADDSSYRKLPSEISPYLRFEVTSDAFVVETNEDGFTRANIEAICATGKSSKKILKDDNHIGEKGFGFKSVFSIADEVQIQSGFWSFCFRHSQGEDGLGMVTPLDASPDVLPDDVTTRITLRYSNEAKREYSRLVEAIKDLPETTIMFLQKLRNLHINITRLDAQCDRVTFAKQYSPLRAKCIITRSQNNGGNTETDTCLYLMFQKNKSPMPTHELRKKRTSATIELAFPLDPTTLQPKLCDDGQCVFAYLPLKQVQQMQFLVQSDFVTSASRETLIDCAWNDALREGVAELFVSAVSTTFAVSNHSLQYSWLDYMPKGQMEYPWKSLFTSIKDALATKNVFQTRGGQFKTPDQCRELIPSMLHCGVPILPDLANEIYLASEYGQERSDVLEELGVDTIYWGDIIDRLQADLIRSSSVLRTTKANDPWHDAFAELFTQAFDPEIPSATQSRIKRLAIIPLSKPNQWTGAPGVASGGSDRIYFPYTKTTPIPGSLGLKLLDKTASRSAKRKALYKAMGVEECSRRIIFAKIKEVHNRLFPPFDTIDQLQYLFHQRCVNEDVEKWIHVTLTSGTTTKSWRCELYFPSSGEHDMYQLLPAHVNFRYISTLLFDAEPTTVRVNNETWHEWLSRMTGAMYHPPLKSPRDSGVGWTLSGALRAVLAQNPTKFLGTLRAHWSEYGLYAHFVDQDLRECAVPCISGNQIGLSKTYLPTKTILQALEVVGVSRTAMPLLQLPEATLNETSHRSWMFLEEFGAESKPDLTFYILAIRAKSRESEPMFEQVAEIYRCMARLTTVQDYDSIREVFDHTQNPCMWDGDLEQWVTRSECILNGPDFISFTTVLSRTYGEDALVHSLFSTILGIPDCQIGDVLEELESRRDNGSAGTHLSLTSRIYAFLATKASTEDDWQKIKSAFTEKNLVLGEHRIWHNVSTCLWESPYTLADFQNISTIYGDLRDFFVRRLGIKKASLSMLINEVKRMAEEAQPRIDEVRTRLISIGYLLTKHPMSAGTTKALDDLKEVKFLPKNAGENDHILVGVTDDFAIPDHQRYRHALLAHNVLLAFELDDVQMLHAMFEHLGLTGRYLSNTIKEVSTVEDSHENVTLSRQLQAKAYALYCCAAKYKSSKALRNDQALYQQLSQAVICIADEISTNLVLPRAVGSLSIRSDRSFIHHDVVDGKLHIYVPEDASERRACYRSQLPKLLAIVLSVGTSAVFNISSIISSTLRDLDAIMMEEDIPPVRWIEKPVLDITELVAEERPHTTVLLADDSDAATLVQLRSGIMTPEMTPQRGRVMERPVAEVVVIETVRPSLYPELIEQVVRSARRAASRYTGVEVSGADTLAAEGQRYFDTASTFGSVEQSMWRRIGAAGEAYIFELLSNLNIPTFTLANWQSTIRGELSVSTHFSRISNWLGRETADLVYKDCTGDLTQYLRAHCEGSFPSQISERRNFMRDPIEYFLEVKSSTHDYSTRFYMSGGQYTRMENMALEEDTPPSRVYVILRVYDLTRPNVGLKIFVDPMRFKGRELDFEAEKWYVTAR